jgi:hypothetical protein
LAVAPSASWLWFTGAVSLSYLAYFGGSLPFWVRVLEFFPLYALLAWEWRTARPAARATARQADVRAAQVIRP